ncbi:hypothetical protein GQ53DRAFT_340955 [Thozetella sp. PMI_491]|nr:hypothetical protein GQ53DRAFT_340955 [Thozetella sp. PMI_491]
MDVSANQELIFSARRTCIPRRSPGLSGHQRVFPSLSLPRVDTGDSLEPTRSRRKKSIRGQLTRFTTGRPAFTLCFAGGWRGGRDFALPIWELPRPPVAVSLSHLATTARWMPALLGHPQDAESRESLDIYLQWQFPIHRHELAETGFQLELSRAALWNGSEEGWSQWQMGRPSARVRAKMNQGRASTREWRLAR